MPLYVYTCRTCELELEEMHPVGHAPDRSIRCPLCGGYFERTVSLFHIGAGDSGPPQPEKDRSAPSTNATHGPSCPCCFPTRRS